MKDRQAEDTLRANEEMLERNKKLLDEWEVEKFKLEIDFEALNLLLSNHTLQNK